MTRNRRKRRFLLLLCLVVAAAVNRRALARVLTQRSGTWIGTSTR